MKVRSIRKVVSALLCVILCAGCLLQSNMHLGKAEDPEKAVWITNASLSVWNDGKLGMNLYIGITDSSMMFDTVVSVDGVEYPFEYYDDMAQGYCVTCYMCPKDIEREFEISVHQGDTVFPIFLNAQHDIAYSLKQSAMDLLKEYEKGNDKNAKLAKAIDDYGSSARIYFANDPNEEAISVEDVDLTPYACCISGALPKGASYYGSCLILDEAISIRHYFSLQGSPESLQVYVDDAQVSVGAENNLYYIEIPEIGAYDIDKAYNTTVVWGDNRKFNVEYSVLSYAFDAVMEGRSEKLSALVKSIYHFNKTVSEFGEDPGQYSPMPAELPKIEYPSINPDVTVGDCVYYSYFGAKGDGVTNDYGAIVSAHRYANEHHLPVKADEGAVYYISDMDATSAETMKGAIIRTDTDWTGATFIIDDSQLYDGDPRVQCWLFTVESYLEPVIEAVEFGCTLENGKTEYYGKNVMNKFTSLMKGQTKVEATFEHDMLFYIYDSNYKNYRRTGIESSPRSQQEPVVIRKDGTIDSESRLTYDYPEITRYEAYPIDDTVLTIRGGVFHSILDDNPRNKKYHYRFIYVKRSNVVLEEIEHYLDEDKYDMIHHRSYYGFIAVHWAYNTTIRNCKLASHYATGYDGSYDLIFENSIGIYMENITETDDIRDRTRYGIMGANYCKNINADHCEISRFDVHKGTTDCTVKNSVIGHCGIRLIGQGTALFENTTTYGKYFIHLREDFGSNWDGDIVIKDCTWCPNNGEEISGVIMIFARNYGYTDYGYVCHLPNVYVDGLKLLDEGVGAPGAGTRTAFIRDGVTVFYGYSSHDYDANPYQMQVCKEVVVQNVQSLDLQPDKESKVRLCNPNNGYLFEDIDFQYTPFIPAH